MDEGKENQCVINKKSSHLSGNQSITFTIQRMRNVSAKKLKVISEAEPTIIIRRLFVAAAINVFIIYLKPSTCVLWFSSVSFESRPKRYLYFQRHIKSPPHQKSSADKLKPNNRSICISHDSVNYFSARQRVCM